MPKLTGSKRLIVGNARLIAFLIVFATLMPLLPNSASVKKAFVSDAREQLSVEVDAAGRNVSAINSGWKPDTISAPLIDASSACRDTFRYDIKLQAAAIFLW
ncbi:hypothetical protein IQ285_32440 [Burkholderia sp. R-69608]|uniref:hypothetical protein n=1 Tax=Paraburkholderia nemoris TaxID=2793076 RepID=UPI001913C454|nr:hypothetical protein [Paraburkholderia nemoris]MBK5152409.1 hypothetical protein [Burkholderia sp. R-69608]